MEKGTAIKKINQIGKVGCIISTVAQVFAIIGLVGVLIGSVVMAVFPKEAITVTLRGTADVNLNLNRLGGTMITEQQIQELKDLNVQDEETSFEMNDSEYLITNIEPAPDGVKISAETSDVTLDLKALTWPLISALLYMIMTIVTIHFIKSLCKEIKVCESPFSEGVITKIKRLAYSLIPWVFISGITDSIAGSAFTGKVNVDLNIELGMVMVVLIVLALAYIFRYGAVLQQESDETL